MRIALSTRWNAGRHTTGEKLVEEILQCGFTRLELGYDLTIDLVPGVRDMVRTRAITVDSVHNFCPVPVGAPGGSPELFSMASTVRSSDAESGNCTLITSRPLSWLGIKPAGTRLARFSSQARSAPVSWLSIAAASRCGT